MQVAIGAAFAAAVAALAYRARSLSAGGAAIAFIVGAIVFGAGGWRGAATLFAFFLPSTLLSQLGKARKRAIGDDAHGPRNGWQVLANGGIAALCALAGLREGGPIAAAFAGAFAAASADTWATEIGVLSQHSPVSILTLRRVEQGRSGGVSLLGSGASIGGAVCVAAVAATVGLAPFWSVALGGIAGSAADSLLGASLQSLRWCPRCNSECETRRHNCGSATELRRGVSWIENDAVNFAATLCGAVVASLLTKA